MSFVNNTTLGENYYNVNNSSNTTSIFALLSFMSALMVQKKEQVQDALDAFSHGVQREIAAIKDPVDKSIVAVGETQCSNVKKLIGVDYEQVNNENEPDLNNLYIVFKSRKLHVKYKLSTAAHSLSEARGFDTNASLIIFFHGFIDSTISPVFASITKAFLSVGDYNILGLDTSSLTHWLYLRSTTYVRFIGERFGEVLAAMVNKGLDPGSIHLIGHSLGAHTAGFTAKQFFLLMKTKVGRITGLDPAGPCFSLVEPELRLNASDANFVDVIHTNSGVLGITERVGHVDFFPNGGSRQPACLLQTCNHLRVIELFTESIADPKAFPARQCDNYDAFKKGNCTKNFSVMGYHCQPTARGAYYLRTSHSPPYSLGEGGARWKNDESILGSIGNVGSEIFG